jgi:hypothetical protein
MVELVMVVVVVAALVIVINRPDMRRIPFPTVVVPRVAIEWIAQLPLIRKFRAQILARDLFRIYRQFPNASQATRNTRLTCTETILDLHVQGQY